jgi:hypothetical protein
LQTFCKPSAENLDDFRAEFVRSPSSFVRGHPPQRDVDTTGCVILHAGQKVRVNVQGEAYRGMA